ncbi:hypothetical protein CSB37_01475 [bacterium DOLZORAL124_38_8]|nr:MAG: hypothetical protein CSB37_01475 [bacterium DOLZORAL124_38_8]
MHCVYIMTNIYNTTFYVGRTSCLERRVFEHKLGFVEGFTKKYKCTKLVYFECCDDFYATLERERKIKKYPRHWKLRLIETKNPQWDDLSEFIS